MVWWPKMMSKHYPTGIFLHLKLITMLYVNYIFIFFNFKRKFLYNKSLDDTEHYMNTIQCSHQGTLTFYSTLEN